MTTQEYCELCEKNVELVAKEHGLSEDAKKVMNLMINLLSALMDTSSMRLVSQIFKLEDKASGMIAAFAVLQLNLKLPLPKE